MKIGLLTTDTPHHRHFIHELTSAGLLSFVIFETRGYPWAKRRRRHFRKNLPNLYRALVLNPYRRSERFERERDLLEEQRFALGKRAWPPRGTRVETVSSVNDHDCRSMLIEESPDLLFVYGTGIVKKDVFSLPRLGTVNAHGGLLPKYRGLDTNLWAAYLGHPEEMAVTLHEMEQGIDTGAVYVSRRLSATPDLCRLTLRYHTTLLCTEMAVELGRAFDQRVPGKAPQPENGGYFGPMPPVLQRRADAAIKRFARGSDQTER